MLIKVCGMGNAEIMKQLAEFPIDMLGFVFYSKSPRYVVGRITPEDISNLPKRIRKVGVFVDETPDKMISIAKEYNLDALQLHGNEPHQVCQRLCDLGYFVIKAFNPDKRNNYREYVSSCDLFLFDTSTQSHGGSGQKFNWENLSEYTDGLPFMLSGGIGPNDAAQVLSVAHPLMAGVDVNSCFETAPGVKNVGALHDFLFRIRE